MRSTAASDVAIYDPEAVQQQKTAEAMLQATPQVAAAQPRQARQRLTTTNCAWFGNELNCTAVR